MADGAAPAAGVGAPVAVVQPVPQFRMVPGRRVNELVLIDQWNNYVWHKNGGNWYRCCKSWPDLLDCRASLFLRNGEYVIVNPEHTHEDDRVLIRNMELVNWCKQEVVANLHRPIFDIFNEAVLRFAGASVAFPRIVRSLQRIRSSVNLANPSTILEANDLMTANAYYRMNHDGTRPFYAQMVQTRNPGHLGMVYIIDELLEEFVHTEEVHLDGTFHIVPTLFHQMATLTFFRFGKMFVIGWFLMSHKDQELYEECIKVVLERARERCGRVPQPVHLIADFELAILQALKKCFPTGQARGCYFHSSNAIFDYAVGLGLKTCYRDNADIRTVIRMAIALARLPPNYIERGHQLIVDYNLRRNGNLPAPTRVVLDQFLDYVKSFWMTRVGAERFSVWRLPRRTNNDQESLHLKLKNKFRSRAHIGFCEFSRGIQEFSASMVIEFHNAAAGIPIRAPRRMEHVQRDRDIIIKEEELVTGRISVFDYLLHSSNFFFPIRYDLENPLPLPVWGVLEVEQAAFAAAIPHGAAIPLPLPRDPPDLPDHPVALLNQQAGNNQEFPGALRGRRGVRGRGGRRAQPNQNLLGHQNEVEIDAARPVGRGRGRIRRAPVLRPPPAQRARIEIPVQENEQQQQQINEPPVGIVAQPGVAIQPDIEIVAQDEPGMAAQLVQDDAPPQPGTAGQNQPQDALQQQQEDPVPPIIGIALRRTRRVIPPRQNQVAPPADNQVNGRRGRGRPRGRGRRQARGGARNQQNRDGNSSDEDFQRGPAGFPPPGRALQAQLDRFNERLRAVERRNRIGGTTSDEESEGERNRRIMERQQQQEEYQQIRADWALLNQQLLQQNEIDDAAEDPCPLCLHGAKNCRPNNCPVDSGHHFCRECLLERVNPRLCPFCRRPYTAVEMI